MQLATVAVFAGRAYQHLFWDAPYREVIWDPYWSAWIVESVFGLSWDEFARNPAVDAGIRSVIFGLGVFYLLCALTAVFVKKTGRRGRGLMIAGSAALVLLAVAYTKARFYHFGQFFEYTLQFSSPLFLVYLLGNGLTRRLILSMKIAIALTFTCHGLYALGYYPVPGLFMSMTIHILGTDASQTLFFLKTAGILDFLVAIGIFLPAKFSRWFLLYAIFWGGATALARILGNFYWQFPLDSLHQWAYEAVYRFPHFLIPAAVWLVAHKGGPKILSAPIPSRSRKRSGFGIGTGSASGDSILNSRVHCKKLYPRRKM